MLSRWSFAIAALHSSLAIICSITRTTLRSPMKPPPSWKSSKNSTACSHPPPEGWMDYALDLQANILHEMSRRGLLYQRLSTPELHQRRSEGSWRGVSWRFNNGVLSSMQKQTKERTKVQTQNDFMSSFHFRGGWKYYASCSIHTTLLTIMTCPQRTRVHFCPRHWLLCHLGLY